MFHNIPKMIPDRMRQLEEMDSRDRADGTGRMQRLRQIPSEMGKFLALLVLGGLALIRKRRTIH